MTEESTRRSRWTRSRTGCWTCRDAGYKCDELKPQCGRCVRLRIHCKGYGLRFKWRPQDGRGRRRSIDSRCPPQTTCPGPDPDPGPGPGPLLSMCPSDMTLQQYRLLRHWTSHTSPLLCTLPRCRTNPFQMYLTPMALRDTGSSVRHAVLSIAASHLAASDFEPYPCGSLAVAAQSYRIAAIASLRETLSQRSIVAVNIDSLLASILLLEISKQFDGASHRSEGDVDHLLGATELILARGGPQSVTSPCGRFLLTQLLYHDVLSAVSKGCGPLIRRFGLSRKEISSLQLDLESSRGYHATVLQAVAQISELKVRKAGGFSPADLMFLRTKIKECSRVHGCFGTLLRPGSHYECPSRSRAHLSPPGHLRHRSAASPHTLSCTTVYRLPRRGASFVSSGIGTYLAAIYCWVRSNRANREFVQQRLLDIYKERKIPSLRKVRELIEHVWLSKDFTHSTQGAEGMSRLGCIEIVKGLGEMLHLV